MIELRKLSIVDLAIAMGRINRWAGLGAFALSIAQHQTTLSYFTPPPLRRAALIHDVVEIFMGGDMIDPIKRSCPGVLAAEDRLQHEVCRLFNVRYSDILSLSFYDKAIRFDEEAALWPDRVVDKSKGLGAIVDPMTPEAASVAWMRRYFQLFPGDKHAQAQINGDDHDQGDEERAVLSPSLLVA